MKPTKVQREILTLAIEDGGDLVEACYDYGAPCVDAHRHYPWRTFTILKDRGWIAPYTAPPCSVGYWFVTDEGRKVVAA